MMEGSPEVVEEKDAGPEVQVAFPASVMSRIEELMGGTEQFDSAEFDAVAYINRLFPTEQSLAGVESAAARCQFRLQGVEDDIRRLVRAQPAQRRAGRRLLAAASTHVASLALQVADINKKAERSESMVREITSEIKQLDCAKSNLTAAITALNHYHMLVGGVSQLQDMADQRRYKEILMPMQAIMEVLEHFEGYSNIKEICVLRERVTAVRQQLAKQILDDFKEAFTGGSKSGVSGRSLSEAARAADVLDPALPRELRDWFLHLQLQEYVHLFSMGEEVSWLDAVERRYSWLKKHLLSFEQTHAALFPPHWRLSELIARRFCAITKSELSAIMTARAQEIDVKLLLYAIQKTYHFELLLHKRFTGTALPSDRTENLADEKGDMFTDDKDGGGQGGVEGDEGGGGEGGASPWIGAIGACFEPHLSLYITSLDANLSSLIDRFVQEGAASAGGAGGAVLPSCVDLFLFYKKCLVQCTQLSTGEPMIELAGVFQKYLREYSERVLAAALPGAGGGAAGGGQGGAAHLVSNLQTLLQADSSQHARYSKEDICRITSVITTAEYCLETTVHLEQKLKEKVSAGLAGRVDFLGSQEVFQARIESCMQLLVVQLEARCVPALAAGARGPWHTVRAVGDQSPYVGALLQQLHSFVPDLRDNLANSRKYFTQFCIRFANSFIPKFIQNLYKCKPISTLGSEQLLLDTHMLKTALLELPSMGSQVRRPAPATYTKVVIKLMTKAEMILKLVMAPIDGNLEAFVGQTLQLLPDCSLQEFHKVLDMKGQKLSKQQMTALDALFKQTAKANSEAK